MAKADIYKKPIRGVFTPFYKIINMRRETYETDIEREDRLRSRCGRQGYGLHALCELYPVLLSGPDGRERDRDGRDSAGGSCV